jgi:hypothetical protein
LKLINAAEAYGHSIRERLTGVLAPLTAPAGTHRLYATAKWDPPTRTRLDWRGEVEAQVGARCSRMPRRAKAGCVREVRLDNVALRVNDERAPRLESHECDAVRAKGAQRTQKFSAERIGNVCVGGGDKWCARRVCETTEWSWERLQEELRPSPCATRM